MKSGGAEAETETQTEIETENRTKTEAEAGRAKGAYLGFIPSHIWLQGVIHVIRRAFPGP